MSNYKFTVGHLMARLYDALAEGQVDPDTPVMIADGATELHHIDSMGLGENIVELSVPYKPDPVDEESMNRRWGKRTYRRHDWKRVDWSKPTGVIAHELDVSPSQVSEARRKYAKRTLRPRRKG